MASRARPVVDESAQYVNRNLTLVAATLAVGLIAWMTLRPPPMPETVEPVTTTGAAHSNSNSWWGAPPASTTTRSANPAGPENIEAGFQKYVDGKYRYLFKEATRAPQAQSALRAALLERERLAVIINTARQSSDQDAKDALPAQLAHLAELDRKIGALLPPAQLTAFDVLKDSDIEQFQLDDYAGGISNVAPLSESDKQSILYTKLVYRQRFRQVLNESGLMRGDLSAAERRLVFADVSRALRDYQASYLQEVRQYLYNDEQFTLLSNYENSEYTAELAKLRGIADKGD